MDAEQERNVVAAIVRFVVRAGIALFAGLYFVLLVAWGSERLGLLGGWAFMHSNFALPALITGIVLIYWATGFLPYLKRTRKGNDAV